MKTKCNVGLVEIDPGQEWECEFAPGLSCFGRTEAEARENATVMATAAGCDQLIGGTFADRELSGLPAMQRLIGIEIVSRDADPDETGLAIGADGFLTGADGRFYRP